MVFAETLGKLAGVLSGPTDDASTTGFSPRVIVGPATVGGAPIPYVSSQQFASGFGPGGRLPGSIVTPSPYFRVMSVPAAAGEFYAKEPGAEVVSAAPGAADLWRDLAAGFLPTLRPEGQAHSVSDGGGFTGQTTGGSALGSVAAGFGGTAGLLLVVGLVGLGLYWVIRK